MHTTQPLSNLQRELLKIYSSDISETDLLAVKRYLAKYFASKAINDADSIWEQKGYNNDTMNQWLNEGETSYENKSGH